MGLATDLLSNTVHVSAEGAEVVYAIGCPLAVAVSAVIVGDGMPAHCGELAGRAPPGVAGLSSPVGENYRGCGFVSPAIRTDLYTILGIKLADTVGSMASVHLG